MSRRGAQVLLAALMWPVGALATVPASREQILCAYPNLAIGRIIDAVSLDCRLVNGADKGCWERKIAFSFIVENSLKGRNLPPGEALKGEALFTNDVPMKVGTTTVPMNEAWGQFSFPATGKPLGSVEARQETKGQRFIFGFEKPSLRVTTGAIFSVADLKWIERVVTDPRCIPSTSVWYLERP